jgi:RNA polymerase sigma-70 factor (ECF subfamily)
MVDEHLGGAADSGGFQIDLSGLPRLQREILMLRVMCGLSAEETAEALGRTPTAIRIAQHRALTQLRKTASLESLGR